jgi:hypothetical protein
MSTKRLTAATTIIASFVAVIVSFVGPNLQHSAATTPTSKSTVLYLDIGASVSVGFQPTPRDPTGQPTNRGYSNRLVTIEAARGVT